MRAVAQRVQQPRSDIWSDGGQFRPYQKRYTEKGLLVRSCRTFVRITPHS
jgi:hypothetical protein